MPICSACERPVYTTEELRCLEKVWHKACFRCQTCNKVLAIHNFKGYEGKPYCTVHYPQLKSFTLVKDTPELQQVAINTKNMSKVLYHKDYENSKGTKISVSDDPILRGQREIAKNVSNVNYSQRLPPPAPYVPGGMCSSSYNQRSTNEQRNGGSWYSESIAYPQQNPAATDPSRLKGTVDAGRQCTSPQSQDLHSNTSTAGSNGAAKQPLQTDEEVYRPDLIMIGGMRVTGSGMHFQAVYNYEAAEDDEVSFREGDEILHGEPIDEGWMFGTVQRTGKFGMLPSNYVVPIQGSNFRQ